VFGAEQDLWDYLEDIGSGYGWRNATKLWEEGIRGSGQLAKLTAAKLKRMGVKADDASHIARAAAGMCKHVHTHAGTTAGYCPLPVLTRLRRCVTHRPSGSRHLQACAYACWDTCRILPTPDTAHCPDET
jgi:hypothetical protein